MNDINTVTISRGEYELLIRGKSKLEIIERTVRNDSDAYGYSSNTRAILEAVLGIHNKEKGRLRCSRPQSAKVVQMQCDYLYYIRIKEKVNGKR